MLQDTSGIPYCDTSLNTPYDGTRYGGYHYFKNDDIYCQWNVEASQQILCKRGSDGLNVPPPADAKRLMMARDSTAANHSALLHAREPERQYQIYNEERAWRLKEMSKRESARYPHIPTPSY